MYVKRVLRFAVILFHLTDDETTAVEKEKIKLCVMVEKSEKI